MGEARPSLLQFYENSKYPEESYPDLCTDFTPNGIINVEDMGRNLFTFYVKYCFYRADFLKKCLSRNILCAFRELTFAPNRMRSVENTRKIPRPYIR